MIKIKQTYSLFFILFFGINIGIKAQDKYNLIVTGTVIDSQSKEALAGINVRTGQYSSVLTDEKGNFSIRVPNYSATLTVTNGDYEDKEIAVKGRKNVNIKIHQKGFNGIYSDVDMLLGKQTSTSIINSIETKKIKTNTTRETLANNLNGEFSGVRAIMKSGVPGSGANIFIRGYNTLNASTQPLIVIDGMILETNTFNANNISEGYTYDPLSDINPRDISNITVIKDAASIYGSRGANGVILIETNKTQDVTTKIDFYVQGAYNVTPNYLPTLNNNQYKSYLSDQISSSGRYTSQEIEALPFFNENTNFVDYQKYHNSTDWQDQVFNNSYANEYYFRVTGGDEIVKYGLSVGYTTNNGIVKGNKFDRLTTRFNADTNITDRFSLKANLSVTYGDRDLYNDGLFSTSPIFSALNKSPFLTPFLINNEKQTTDIYEDIDDIDGFTNPRAVVDNITSVAQNYNLYSNLNFGYKLSDDIKVNSLFGINYIKSRQNLFLPDLGLSSTFNEYGDELDRASKVSTEGLLSFYNDTRLNYTLDIDNINKFSFNVGFRYNQNEYETSLSTIGNSSDDQFTSLNSGDGLTATTSGVIGNWRSISFYGNIDYSFLNKYFVSANVSADESSRFGDSTGTAIFPSLGGGWLLSSEDFMSDVSIDQLKLRGSYGLTGNDDIGNYTSESYFVANRFLEGGGLVNDNIANSSIQWEETTKINLGLDLGLFNEKLSLSFDYFKNTTDKLLNETQISPIFGQDVFLSNEGSLENTGFELSFNARLVNTQNFSWDIGGSISQYKNEITSIPGQEKLINNANTLNATIINREGSALGLFYGYKTDGIYNNSQAAAEDGLNWIDFQDENQAFVAGDVKFVNTDDTNNVIDENDRVVIGDPNPDFTGTFYNTFTYKSFSLSAVFTFSQGNDVYNALRWQTESMSGLSNQSLAVANRWQVENQNTNIPRAVYGDAVGNSRFSDRWIEDGSYVRLKTLSLSYNPTFFNATFYVTANNLFTFTKYLGYDPEVSSSQTTFLQGIDAGVTPQYSSVALGVRIGL